MKHNYLRSYFYFDVSHSASRGGYQVRHKYLKNVYYFHIYD